MSEQDASLGLDLDWFGRDADGAFAMFATAGAGPIPEAVERHQELHDAASGLVPRTLWGTPRFWEGAASVGLFAYDWSEVRRRYVRKAVRAGRMPPDLLATLQTPSIPLLPARFVESEEIDLETFGT